MDSNDFTLSYFKIKLAQAFIEKMTLQDAIAEDEIFGNRSRSIFFEWRC